MENINIERKIEQEKTQQNEFKQVKETPFTIIKTTWNGENEEYRIAIGNKVISKEIYKTEKECITYINKKPWELIINTIALITKTINNE